jgi:hypothetical protein
MWDTNLGHVSFIWWGNHNMIHHEKKSVSVKIKIIFHKFMPIFYHNTHVIFMKLCNSVDHWNYLNCNVLTGCVSRSLKCFFCKFFLCAFKRFSQQKRGIYVMDLRI